ncbi:MAG: hypothetical protein RIQ84_1287 [Pseudomonadota bacterium]
MSSEWATVRLGEVTSLLGDGLHGTPVYDQFGEYFFINGSNLKDGRIEINEATKKVSRDEFKKHRKQLNDRTILVSINGTLGNVAIYRGEPIILGKSACYLNVNNEIDKDFVRYVLDSQIFQNYVSNLATGSTIKNVSLKLMRDFSFNLPPPVTQKSIASILSSIDDRITLLRETNATLEAIAQALFKSWFVDFDPVRAKSEGKLPEGMDEATAALFPNAFDETELGMVPKGWQFSTLSSLTAFQNGYAFKGSDWAEQGHPVIKIGNVKPLLIDFDGCSYVSPETVLGLDRFKLGRGDLLVGMTGYVGETGLVTHTEVASYLNQRVGRIATNKGLDDLGFVFAAVRQTEFKAYAESQSHGSAQANVSGTDLMKFSVVIPPAQVLDKFNQVVGNLIEKILANFEEAKTLTNLRDTLLPRLISGQLRIADAEAELEKVTA